MIEGLTGAGATKIGDGFSVGVTMGRTVGVMSNTGTGAATGVTTGRAAATGVSCTGGVSTKIGRNSRPADAV